jgi:hypothetical protein
MVLAMSRAACSSSSSSSDSQSSDIQSVNVYYTYTSAAVQRYSATRKGRTCLQQYCDVRYVYVLADRNLEGLGAIGNFSDGPTMGER